MRARNDKQPEGWAPRWWVNLTHNTGVLLMCFQVCVIYVTSGLWKLQGTRWESGEAVYYVLRVKELAFIPALNDLVWHITPLVIVASWISVYVQLVFPLALLNRWTRRICLVMLIGMHFGIGVFMSLPFFSFMMMCVDTLFISERTWGWVDQRLVYLRDRLKRGQGSDEELARASRGVESSDLEPPDLEPKDREASKVEPSEIGRETVQPV